MLYGASVGPFGGRTWWPTHVLDRLDAITVRDRPSLDELRRIGVARPRVVLAADAALGLPVPIPIPPDGPRPHVGVSVLHWHKFARGNFASYCDAVASALDTLLEDWAAGVTFMSTTVAPSGSADDVSGTSRDDLSAAYEVKGRMKHGDRAATWDRPLGVAELRARIGGFDLWIGTRMHSCIFATTAGLPTVAIGYEPKVAGYFELLGLPELVLDIESVSAADLVRLATNAWRDRDRLQTQMGARLPQLRNDALLSARVAAELAAEGRAGRARAPHSGSRTEA
jgi:colanic acid/amylovoran biosynthesis protein